MSKKTSAKHPPLTQAWRDRWAARGKVANATVRSACETMAAIEQELIEKKKKIKKALKSLASLVLSLSLVACSTGKETETATRADGSKYSRTSEYTSLGGKGSMMFGRGMTWDNEKSFRDASLAITTLSAAYVGYLNRGVEADEAARLAEQDTIRQGFTEQTARHAAEQVTARAAIEAEVPLP